MFSREELNQLYRYCLSLTKNEEAAYDLLQDGLEKCLGRRNILNPKGYLMKTIRNHFFDNMRHEKMAREIALEGQEPNVSLVFDTPSLEDILVNREDVVSILDSLNAAERELLYFWAVEEFTFQEISDFLNVSRGTLLSRLHRLRKKVQLHLSTNSERSEKI